MIDTCKPDLILMDIQMPVMDGYHAAEILKKSGEWKEIPLIALTASIIKEEYNELFDGVIKKPFRKHQIIKEIKKLLPK